MDSVGSRIDRRPPAARAALLCAATALLGAASCSAQTLKLDEMPVAEGEWGYRPAAGAVSRVTPPSFCWRPQPGMTWQLECFRGEGTAERAYAADGVVYNVHCPPRALPAGTYTWRYRGRDAAGRFTNWSRLRTFRIAGDAAKMPLPPRRDLLGRIPKQHPRLFVRPEELPRLRALAKGRLKDRYESLLAECEKILASPPSTAEPPKYPRGTVSGSEPWRKIWWGNRTRTTAALNAAATLAFTRRLGGPARYGLEAKRILLACAKWDPRGSTGYRYNDEAGMPYAYYFSRTYTFVHDLLSEPERALCRRVMKVRGDQMYRHLYPLHLWRPYRSHRNRAWHFLGEVGIAFAGEIKGAEDWIWFAANVFFNVYPVWSDDDGGWHEGSTYWRSYQGRFTWWADVMRAAMRISAYDKPYYSKAGYYCLYLMPPGKLGGGFGDLTTRARASRFRRLMTTLAAQARNGHWQWWVERAGGPAPARGYVGFVRGALPAVKPAPPDDLPASRLFGGTGQAVLNSDLTDAGKSVQVVFKCSPFGTQSHGYEANNAFLLWGYGKRLLIRTGRRDSYGSDHHKKWMWSARSVNTITVDGRKQWPHSRASVGRITAFRTTPAIDGVVGTAAGHTRAVLFVKPGLVVVFDRLQADKPSRFDYWLHGVNRFEVTDQHRLSVRNGDVVCGIDFLTPAGLTFRQTDRYEPPPRRRIRLREWHLTATPKKKSRRAEFVTVYRVRRAADPPARPASLTRLRGGYALRAEVAGGEVVALLPADPAATLEAHGLSTKGAIKVRLKRADGTAETISLSQSAERD